MSRHYLISKSHKAVLLLTPSAPRYAERHGYTMSLVFSPALTRASAIVEWRRIFGPSIEEVYVPDGVQCPVFPWAAPGGGWKADWKGWYIEGSQQPAKSWEVWPPDGGDLALLGLIREPAEKVPSTPLQEVKPLRVPQAFCECAFRKRAWDPSTLRCISCGKRVQG